MFLRVLIFLSLWLYCRGTLQFLYNRGRWDSDIFGDAEHLIKSKGYPVEEHTARTPDGYFLTLHRIPYGRNGTNGFFRRQPVVVFHGLLGSSADYVINFPHNSLAFMLADSGYDVWLSNFRGNTYSRKHEKYSVYQKKFWNFTVDDYAFKDIPTIVNYVLNKTKRRRISSVAYSLGNGAMFALLSSNNTFAKKIIVHIALAPSFQLNHQKSPFFTLSALSQPFLKLTQTIGAKGDLTVFRPFFDVLARHLCRFKVIGRLCPTVLYSVDGVPSTQFNMSRIPVYLSHFPAGSSVYVLRQMLQTMKARKYQKYDYGWEGNLMKYNSTEPPSYDLSQITTPIGLYWSQSDMVSEPRDIHYLRTHILTLVRDYVVPAKDFTHLSFVFGSQAGELIYNDVIQLLNTYRRPF